MRKRRIAERKYKYTSDSGSGSEDEREAGKHGPKYRGRNIEANLSGISKKTRRPP